MFPWASVFEPGRGSSLSADTRVSTWDYRAGRKPTGVGTWVRIPERPAFFPDESLHTDHRRSLKRRRDSACGHPSAPRWFYLIDAEPSDEKEYDDDDNNYAEYSQSTPFIPQSECHALLYAWQAICIPFLSYSAILRKSHL
jgi:hypothetical protein